MWELDMKILRDTMTIGTILAVIALASLLPHAVSAASVSPTTTSGVVATIIVGGPETDWIAYNPQNNKVYVSHVGSCYGCIGSISVIDASTNRVVSEIGLGGNPGSLLYNPANGHIYASYAGGVAVIDQFKNKVLATIRINNAGALAYNSVNHNVYVEGWQTIWIVDSSTNKVTGQITRVSGSNLTFDSNKGYLYASDDYANTLLVVNTSSDQVIASIPMCQYCDPGVMAFDPINSEVYLANFGHGTVSVVSDSTNQITATITVGNNPWGTLYDPLNQRVYVANYASGQLSKIDPGNNTVNASFNAGSGPWRIALDSSNGLLYLTNLGSDTVTVVYP